LDVLSLDRIVERRDGYVVVRSPSNPTHYWGNLLLADDPPGAGDGARWEERFRSEFGSEGRVQHQAFGWDPRWWCPRRGLRGIRDARIRT
jgi:hypothetical protein